MNYHEVKVFSFCISVFRNGHLEYIEDEIRTYGNATLCYELRPEHITGKLYIQTGKVSLEKYIVEIYN